jgi:hypothetical protein
MNDYMEMNRCRKALAVKLKDERATDTIISPSTHPPSGD